MSEPCSNCDVLLNCSDQDPLFMYSLQSELFPFVLVCPPGYRCDTATQFRMVCCGRELATEIPEAADGSERLLLIQSVLAECSRLQFFCNNTNSGGGGTIFPPFDPTPRTPNTQPPPTPQPPPPKLAYYNEPQSCTVHCPDGESYIYTVQAGLFLASSVAAANKQAKAKACEKAAEHKICLGDIDPITCQNATYSSTPGLAGAFSASFPQTNSWSAAGLPGGLSIDASTGEISGMATTIGEFHPDITVVLPNGDTTHKVYSLSVIGITNESPLDPGIKHVDYSYQLSAQGFDAPLSWSASGLPDGLSIDSATGIISGDPSVIDVFNFTVTVSDNSGFSCSKDLSITIVAGPFRWLTSLVDEIKIGAGSGATSQNNPRFFFTTGVGEPPASDFTSLDTVYKQTVDYTGPAADCTFHLNVNNDSVVPSNITGLLEIKVNGSTVFNVDASLFQIGGINAYDLGPFTIPAGVDQSIEAHWFLTQTSSGVLRPNTIRLDFYSCAEGDSCP